MFSKNAEFPQHARANAPRARGIGDRLRAGAQPVANAPRTRGVGTGVLWKFGVFTEH